MEFTDEEKAEYERRVREREARKAREEVAEASKKTVNQKTGPFKSRIGKGIASVLTRTADTAESTRAKADYIGNQAGRIKKAVTPASKPKQQVPRQLRPYQYKPARASRGRGRGRVVYRQPAPVQYQPMPVRQRDPFVDMIEGPRSQGGRSTGDIINELTMGTPKKKNGRDFFKDFLG